MQKKYELCKETEIHNEYVVRRIRAVKDFYSSEQTGRRLIKAGSLGGYVQNESNLSQEGSCWIFDDARVVGSAVVSGNASVLGDAFVFGFSRIEEDATIMGRSILTGCVVQGRATIAGKSHIESTIVAGNAYIGGDTGIYGYNNLIIDGGKLQDVFITAE